VLYDVTKPLIVIAVVLVLVLSVSGVILGQLSSLRIIGSKGKVTTVGVGVYWDANCSIHVLYMDWGSVVLGSVKNITVFIRNEGDAPSTLFLNTTNWSPSNASDYITLTWDYNGYILYPYQTTRVTLMLSIAQVIEGIRDFTFDIIIGVNS